MIESLARKFDPIAVSAESTVVAEYIADPASQAAYQSEAALEQELIRLLESQAYEYLPVTSEAQLVANLRAQLEALNDISFSDAEWAGFFETKIAGRTMASSRRPCGSRRITSSS
ncbi:PDDEXK family nuclease [Tessaracoccus coleopterorum]|uniref:type I site-specific deoxyribonuclease, HsdR n=1 Tax=Tessaracoccus coleopterorum TaxID=2714950 RepID=UPI001E62A1E5|nr:type I site-specific deoxyribonuclease, HsdR [Tessaracoccus coleopterorum]